MALATPHQPLLKSAPRTASGITRDVLLDERNHFIPYDLGRFTKLVFYQPKARFFYRELEVIWQGVPSSSWIELMTLMGTKALSVKAREAQLAAQRSYNIFSWQMWRDRMEMHDVCTKAFEDYNQVMCHSGVYLHMLRDSFIADYNARHPKLDPPLSRTDDLRARLPSRDLPSMAEHRKQFQDRFGTNSTPWFGIFTKQEKRHLRGVGIVGEVKEMLVDEASPTHGLTS
ncbi:BZ3500_MvSof-1268-A1-R1_Chr3-1g05729 [Microbotryum saponariae]|uniref:BZ3500_MvSof-1268-A1-R1_Chr3-1g05716 protein n=1 Tax=Microbotryum saponariae TaxID=289078 RepID=A0A2X0MWM2_9BASI|nr:BZ3500_MvSof-1268-A1-R1_Chr3-1g05716 [Microbotryum saponariae]SCZ98952.1 BZ3500_MvSof-1268-A1-R1_Chr3-1g05729 [Microbotryum saponariae]SDA04906.1 BZ3501_MvSof-1269-A2-R1_Chr3-1g05386 [Microbotryum saponariae]SDA04919.1 BZ3501_MvSof-1269-A2-R1_Chr3-1g05399 [Microbotryum saponariae]